MIALVKLQDSLRSTQVSDKKKKPKSSAKETHLSVNETYTCSKRGPSNKGKRGLQKGYKSEVRTCVTHIFIYIYTHTHTHTHIHTYIHTYIHIHIYIHNIHIHTYT